MLEYNVQQRIESEKMLIIGIDPGLVNTGWAIIDFNKKQSQYISSGTIKTKATEDISKRLGKIYEKLNAVYTDIHPEYGAIEKTLVNVNAESSMLLSMARAIALLFFHQNNIEYKEFMPTHIKKTISGIGSANKNQLENILKYYICDFHSMLKEKEFSSHECDAIAIALCCGFSL